MKNKTKPIPVTIVHEPIELPKEHRPKDSFHMSVRQIENGFIVSRHGYKDGKHYDEEFYSKTPPGGGFSAPKVRAAAPSTAPATATRSAPVKTEGRKTRFASESIGAKIPRNVPSDAPLPPTPRSRSRDSRLMKVKL